MFTTDMKMFKDWMTEQGMGIDPESLEYVLNNPQLLNDSQRQGLEEYMSGFRMMFAPKEPTASRDAFIETCNIGI